MTRTFAALALLLTMGFPAWGLCLPEQPSAESTLYTYAAVLERVIDGDTVVVSLSLGLDVWLIQQHMRLAHINAPEMATPAGKAALAYLQSLVGPLPAQVTVHTVKDRQDKYGRYLGVVVTPQGINVNEAMVQAGHAVPYEGGPR